MSNALAKQIRLFICSLLISLVLIATVAALLKVYASMTDMGIEPAVTRMTYTADGAIIITSGNTYSVVNTQAAKELEYLRRMADPLTLPRPVRLALKIVAAIRGAD